MCTLNIAQFVSCQPNNLSWDLPNFTMANYELTKGANPTH